MRSRTAWRRGATRFASRGRLGRGQALVELAIVLPVLLLIVLGAVDLGRVYLGWINLQQVARIAANFAADHSSAWPGDADVRARYEQIVLDEAANTNCDLDTSAGVPPPSFEYPSDPRPTGSGVTVGFDCTFHLLTPIVSSIVGDSLTASVSATFPVKEGIVVAANPGGGGSTLPPTADFVGTPRSGYSPLTVIFTDLSDNLPAAWSWDFNTGTSGSGVGSVDIGSRSTQGPHTIVYTCTGNAGDTCIFGVRLSVSNAGGGDTVARSTYITAEVPPDSGPIAEFEASPLSGQAPLTVNFAAIDIGGTPAASWQWDFGDGGSDSGESVAHTYANQGVYDVTLTVTDGSGATDDQTKVGLVVVLERVCTVPDFANVKRDDAADLWEQYGFDPSNITYLPPKGKGSANYNIHFQSLTGGLVDPVPDGCDSAITVGP